MTSLRIEYTPPGPVAAGFFNGLAEPGGASMIMGPIGSAKTSTALWKLIFLATRQRPSPIDGWRYVKVAVIRDTYRNLAQTTIPSWFNWFPKTLGKWSGEEPASHHIRFNLPVVGRVDFTIEFIALGEQRVQDVMRGWEGTMAYLNEADLLADDVLPYVMGRVGRYPSKAHGGASWWGVICDMNAPDIDNWTYKLFVEDLPPGWEFWRQPSGLSPDAENIANLPPGYYDKQSAGRPDWYVRRFIRNEFGYSRDGKPVYSEFNDALHFARAPIEPVAGLPLVIGMDAGGTPAATIGQNMPTGQQRVLAEVVAAKDETTGPVRFAGMLNQMLRERFAGFRKSQITAWADPSSTYGADKKNGELNWLQIVGRETGIAVRPCPGNNDPTLRLEAVRRPLTQMIDGQPAWLADPRCRALRKGMNSGYRHRRIAVAGTTRFDEKPEKNEFSHICEADQYRGLGGSGVMAALGRQREHDGRALPALPADFDRSPFA